MSQLDYTEWKRHFSELKLTACKALDEILTPKKTDSGSTKEADTNKNKQASVTLVNSKVEDEEEKDKDNVDGSGSIDLLLRPLKSTSIGQPKIVEIKPMVKIKPIKEPSNASLQPKYTLIAALEAPLLALGAIKEPPAYLNENKLRYAVGDREKPDWVKWWGSTTAYLSADSRRDKKPLTKLIDKVWPQWVVDVVLPAWQNQESITGVDSNNDWVKRCLDPYFFLDANQNDVYKAVIWNNISSIVSFLVKNEGSGKSSQPAIDLLAKLVKDGVTFPTQAYSRIFASNEANATPLPPLSNIHHANAISKIEALSCQKYLAESCALPDKIAALYETATLPKILSPDGYYGEMCLDIVKNIEFFNNAQDTKKAHEFLVLVISKLCRIGKSYLIAKAMDIVTTNSLVEGESTMIDNCLPKVVPPTRIVFLSRIVKSLPPVEFSKLWSACLSTWCSSLPETAKDNDADVYNHDVFVWTTRVANSIRILWCPSTIADDSDIPGPDNNAIIDAQSISFIIRQLSISPYPAALQRALVMSIKLLSTSNFEKNLAVIAKEIFSVWGQSHFVRSAPITLVKSLSTLLILIIGNLSPKSVFDLSKNSDFSDSIYNYFSSPTTITRLLGILVAEAMTRKASRSFPKQEQQSTEKGKKSKQKDNVEDDFAQLLPVDSSAALDFGLDDIVEQGKKDAVTSKRISEEVELIIRMRLLCLPLAKHVHMMMVTANKKSSETIAKIKAVNDPKVSKDLFVSKDAEKDTDIYERRPQSLVGPVQLKSDFVKPRKPAFIRQVLGYLSSKDDVMRVEAGLDSAVQVIKSSDIKELNEVCIDVAKRLTSLFNPGPDAKTLEWDNKRLVALTELGCRLPGKLGPFMCNLCFDRELNLSQRELILAAISSTAMRLSGTHMMNADNSDSMGSQSLVELVEKTEKIQAKNDEEKTAIAPGKTTWKSKRLDIAKSSAQNSNINSDAQTWSRISGPAFFFPLISQFVYRSHHPDSKFDLRKEAMLIPKYLSTLAIIVYTSGASIHQIKMDQEFWDMLLSFRHFKELTQHADILDNILFCLEILVSDDRSSLSTETLAREFGSQLSVTFAWINDMVNNDVLNPNANHKVARLLNRIGTIVNEHQNKILQKITGNFDGDSIFF
ncbi:telomere binding protein [Mycoemilia scoparia]|uniref:Telomere binding protein n=1 Tax=Mycoemilia scoparia TaxID=417184 RepID=A0A9W8DRW6_9FUNG|nr:telomere binding protein [Mycoemilia scoparia]